MRATFLIARQEFIKYVTRRGFFISILMFPIWIMIVVLVPQWLGGAPQRYFTLVDRAGGYREAVLDALARENAARDLKALSQYAAANADINAVRRGAPRLAAMLAAEPTDRSVSAFRLSGGWRPAVATLTPFLRPTAKPFRVPDPRFVFVEPPTRLSHASGGNFGAAARGDLQADRFFAAVYIPEGFGQGGRATAQYFARDLSDGDLRDFVSEALSDALHRNVIKRLAPQLLDSDALDATAALELHNPTKGAAQSGRDDSFDKLVPIALAVILFIVSVMNASVLLQGVVEEKSTRMIEVLLSCATAREITSGKLIGVIAVALVTIAIWALVLFAMMALADASTVKLVFGAIGAVATTETLPLLLLYFFCGLLIYGSIFLAIGSMASSLADAQALLGPAMLILMLPNLMISGVMRDPNGEFATLVSWVPCYTPFFMMLRIASHPPTLQIWGTTLLALGTTLFLIWWMGRVFARHVLTTERPPSLGGLLRGGVQALTGLRR
ncbi:MAG TPA: ABC transporter permease [Rhizomicrobium sp.]|nr:ABC transporter permease [Rhizomicrobium sp.]